MEIIRGTQIRAFLYTMAMDKSQYLTSNTSFKNTYKPL